MDGQQVPYSNASWLDNPWHAISLNLGRCQAPMIGLRRQPELLAISALPQLPSQQLLPRACTCMQSSRCALVTCQSWQA